MTIKKKLLYIGVLLLGLTSCDDFLEVDAPSKSTDEDVISSLSEAEILLNGVYTRLASGGTYGNAYLTTFCLNSDVEFTTSTAERQSPSRNEYKLFDCEADAGNLLSTWNAAYATIEKASNFVAVAEQSELFAARDSSMLQMVGEAKCIRAMNYLDLVIMFGDIPFTLKRAYDLEGLVMPMGQRDEVLTTLINDLIETADNMQFAANLNAGVERCSKEYCWSLIARMALYRGGYSLRHNESVTEVGTMQRPADYLEYYTIARDYSKKVITSGTHSLTKDFYQVFIDECNYKVANADDPIFEIPFAQNVSGSIGHIHGPRGLDSSGGGTDHKWGTASGSVRLNAFYRFTFDVQDARREAIGFWHYDYDGTPILLNDYNNYCNKWSKFWDENAVLGNRSSGNTGINFPYMRYADVLLMFAEADNEINGPTEEAKKALKEVRERAFRYAANSGEMVDAYVDAAASKEDFFQLIVDERAWEFGGENLRWKDLVRWNLYNQVVYKTFWNYYGFGSDDPSYDMDNLFNTYPKAIYYKKVQNPTNGSYPNKEFDVFEFFTHQVDEFDIDCLWKDIPAEYYQKYGEPKTNGSDAWTRNTWYDWLDDNTGIAKPQCRYSLRGYIHVDEQGKLQPSTMPDYNESVDLNTLPPVRYILPIPSDAISRSQGAYKNYYGY